MVWDYATFAAFVLVGGGFLGLIMLVLGLPGRIAVARNHPEADAVNLMDWIGAFTVFPWAQAPSTRAAAASPRSGASRSAPIPGAIGFIPCREGRDDAHVENSDHSGTVRRRRLPVPEDRCKGRLADGRRLQVSAREHASGRRLLDDTMLNAGLVLMLAPSILGPVLTGRFAQRMPEDRLRSKSSGK